MPHKLLIANWKANPATLEEAHILFTAEQADNVIICPPAIYIAELHPNGAQDVFWEAGAHTGQLSTEMLKQFGVTHVLVGHSECRALGETDEQINKKLKAALAADMVPILLIGEPEKSAASAGWRTDYLIDQLTRDLEDVSAEDAKKIMFCYEPVWAISSHPNAKAATVEDALSAIHEMQGIIEKMYGFRPGVLYGGSVNASNVGDFFKHDEISGAVVGGASLKIDEFTKMIEIASKL